MEVSIDTREIEKLAKQIDKAGKSWPRHRKQALGAIGEQMRDTAKEYSPISPTKSQYIATLQDGVTMRDNSSFQPGRLTNSIMSKVVSDVKAVIYIASNKRAGKYADKMENGAGKTWYKLGVGSEAKDAKTKHGYVGGKFVWRGIRYIQKTGKDMKIFNSALDRLKKEMERK